MRSKLLDITIGNLGCVGNEGLTVSLDNILCIVGDNNTGKSTILRAYELAVGTKRFSYDQDYCNRSKGENAYVEISVHIPEGTPNIAEKWKVKDGDLLIVKSRWEWDEQSVKIRKTFDPDLDDYSEEGVAAGLDNVFNSRLPVPFRIGALENPEEELNQLLKLILEPIAINLDESLKDDTSEINKALVALTSEAKKSIQIGKEELEKINKELTESHNKIFPNLSVDLNVDIEEPTFKPINSLLSGSSLNIKEFDESMNWEQQGTGSQRALFWSLLQVRSRLQTLKNIESDNSKIINQLKRDIKKLITQRDSAKKEATKHAKQLLIDEKNEEIIRLNALDPEDAFNDLDDGVNLPGYMLLIDEPEIALHPNGIRAASKYLYELANDLSWQIMLTTHSPLFVNPFEDHTTIVRLSRYQGNPNPKTYRSDKVLFTEDEIENLKLLNSFDQNISEMFFGQYPLVVEGDTEFAAFNYIMKENTTKYPINSQPIIIRARGKYTIIPIIKMLTHFKVNHSVLHDSDYPKNKSGGNNSSWTANRSIYTEIEKSRSLGIKIIHRVSVSTFEIEHVNINFDKDGLYRSNTLKEKPWYMYHNIKNDEKIRHSVEKTLDDLLNEQADEEPFDEKFLVGLNEYFEKWVKNKKIKDERFIINN